MTTHSLKLTVIRPNSRVEELLVHSTRLLVGTGAHCDVRISGPGAGHEHLVIELLDGGLVAHARHVAPPPLHAGQPLIRAALGNDAEISVAGTHLRVTVVDAAKGAKRGQARKMLTSVFCSLAVLALPGLVYATLRQPGEPPIGPPPSEVTPLFDKVSAACPVTAPDQAGASAAALRAVAELQREQHPFAVSDGLASVSSFDAAAACYTRAGQRDEASAMAAARDALRQRIEDDYRVHRVRIEHALDEGEDRMALREVRVLKRMTAGRHGAYISWLDTVERRLNALNALDGADQSGGRARP
jgi:hypothetical protein